MGAAKLIGDERQRDADHENDQPSKKFSYSRQPANSRLYQIRGCNVAAPSATPGDGPIRPIAGVSSK